MMPEVHPDVLEHLEGEPAGDAEGDQPAERVLRAAARPRSARRIRKPSSTTIPAAPTRPSSSPATEKTKSVCWNGMNPPWVCAALEQALAAEAAGADGDPDLPGLVADALRVGGGVGEGDQPVPLVRREHRRRQRHGDRGHDQRDSADDPARGRAGDADHAERERSEHQRRAEVGLEHDQADRHGGDHDRQRAESRLVGGGAPLTPLGEEHGQTDAQGDLGQLGGLHREARRAAGSTSASR